MNINFIYCGDSLNVLKTLPDKSINCCVTSPPYWGLRDYGNDGQLGLEKTPEEYVDKMVAVFKEVRRVLRDDGTLWLNLGDSYNGRGKAGNGEYQNKHTEFGKPSVHKERFGVPTNIKNLKPKDLVGIPWMVAFALRADGWYLRQDIIWHKPNPMPESVTDRCTKSHEYIFLLSKSQKYYYNQESILETATGYDGRKDTLMKGSNKYKTGVVPNQSEHTTAASGHERWRFKNLQDKGQQTQSMHENRLNGYEYLSPVRNKRSVWTVNTKPFKEAHFAVFPEELIVPCIKAGCPEGGIVLDPFMGSGTTAVVSRKLNRNFIGIELNEKYIQISQKRLRNQIGLYMQPNTTN